MSLICEGKCTENEYCQECAGDKLRLSRATIKSLEAKNGELEKKLKEADGYEIAAKECITEMNIQLFDREQRLKIACEALERLDEITVLAESAKLIIKEALSKIKSEGL